MTDPVRENPVEQKLLAARTRLVLDRPFLGALVLRLPLVAGDQERCPRTRTDARSLFYNPAYVDLLTFEQTQFVLSGEALHCALMHFSRRGRREQQRWDIACAHAVNLILLEEGLQAPPDAFLNREFAGKTAEEIYALLEDTERSSAGSQQMNDDANERSGESDDDGHTPPPDQGADDRLALERQWRQRLAGAARHAQQAGGLGAALSRVIDSVLHPALPWRTLLAHFVNGLARDDFSYARPSTRRGDPAIFPSMRSVELDLVAAVDVSGSIDDDEFNEFMSEVNALKSHVRARVTLLTCDSKLTGDSPWVFEAWEPCRLPHTFAGSGATDFRPVFDWIADRQRSPDVLLYFTDAAGQFPDSEPPYSTVWLVKGDRPVPWGRRVQLN